MQVMDLKFFVKFKYYWTFILKNKFIFNYA